MGHTRPRIRVGTALAACIAITLLGLLTIGAKRQPQQNEQAAQRRRLALKVGEGAQVTALHVQPEAEGGPAKGAPGESSIQTEATAAAEETAAAAVAEVTVYASKPSSAQPLDPRKLGTYRSEEGTYRDKDRQLWKEIYEPSHTLGPLRLRTNRFQLALGEGELGPDGTFLDPNGTQLGIMQLNAAVAAEDVFVTVGYPHSATAQRFVQLGFPPGWEEYWNRTFWSTADALATTHWPGKPLWVEFFGEVDLGHWSFVYGSQEVILRATKLAYDAFARYRDRFKLGGCGFSFPETPQVGALIDLFKSQAIEFDFWSFHTFLGWTDATDPAGYPFPPVGNTPNDDWFNIGTRTRKFHEALAARGLGHVPIVCSEYAWQDATFFEAAGLGRRPNATARWTMTHHQGCARTLQAIDLVVAEPLLARTYYAQGVGFKGDPFPLPFIFAWAPLVIYDEDDRLWRYKAGYYGFWMYGRMTGQRVEVNLADKALGAWATRDKEFLRLALWNRSKSKRRGALALPGVPLDWPCHLYRVDASTFKVGGEGLHAVATGPTSSTPPLERSISTVGDALSFLRARELMGEASVFLEIKLAGALEGPGPGAPVAAAAD